MSIGQILVSIADAVATSAATDAAARTVSPPVPAKFSATQKAIVHMLRENTGASILDSGGTSGRKWQQNLLVDFAKEPEATVEFNTIASTESPTGYRCWVDIQISFFHFIAKQCEYDRALTRQLHKFGALAENEGKSWFQLRSEFPDWVGSKRKMRASVLANGNTCNEGNFLSQEFEYTYFELDGDPYVVIMSHNGADLRGGYSTPVVFRCDDEWSFARYHEVSLSPDWKEERKIKEALLAELNRQTFLFPEVEAEIRAEIESYGDDVHWDMGSNEYNGDGCKPWDEYEVLPILDRSEWRKGFLCVLPDHTGLCPETGARLVAYQAD